MKTENHTDWLDRLVCVSAGGKHAKMETRLNMGFAASMLLWGVGTELSDYLIVEGLAIGIWAWMAVLSTIAIGAWVIHRYYRLYSRVDEMTRKILSNALSISLGIGVFVMMVFISLKDVGVWQPPVAVMFVFIVISYIAISASVRSRMEK